MGKITQETRNPSVPPVEEKRMTGINTTSKPHTATDAEDLAERIAQISPEGRPAHPGASPAKIGLIIVCSGIGVILLGVIGAFFIDVAVGLVVAVLGLIMLAMNPQVWAGAARAKERARVAQSKSD